MKTVLIALDFSEHYPDVEQVGYEIARSIGAAVTLITIVNRDLNYTIEYRGMDFANQWEGRLFAANEKLEEIKNNHPETETRIISFIGTPKEEIVEASYDPAVCYVVIGKYGRTGFSSLMIGGTSAFVLQHAIKPVIVVPYKKERH
jgi:nucleotide-binding universal stress UspA family protein